MEPGWVLTANYQRWLLQRRMRTRRQLHEVMTEFWEHHLHVPANGEPSFVYRKSYGDAIRANALGTFEGLLQATTLHPAMLIFLNNAVSTKRHPNENLGRELLELHTVGRGNHTEDDVKNCARILTGWRVDMWDTWRAWYERDDHWTGAGQRPRVSRPERRRRRPGRLPADAQLPRPAPRHGTADRAQARGEVRARRPAAGTRRPARAGLSRPRVGDPAGTPRTRLLGRVPGVRRAQGPDAGRGRGRDLPRPRHHDEQAAVRQQRRQRRPLAVRHPGRLPAGLAATRRHAAGQRRHGPPRPG